MIKLILTLFNIIIFFESIYAQIDTFSIHKKYSDNGLILFSDDFSDNLTVNFNRTDTLNGYEIKY
jgi:hypothetical protein